jgi:hypothetical protein
MNGTTASASTRGQTSHAVLTPCFEGRANKETVAWAVKRTSAARNSGYRRHFHTNWGVLEIPAHDYECDSEVREVDVPRNRRAPATSSPGNWNRIWKRSAIT